MGLGVGFLVGLTSIGGATLMTPFLILVLGVRPRLAIGTDLIYASCAKILGGVIHWEQGLVDVRIVRALAIGSIPGGIAGAMAVYTLERLSPAADTLLRDYIAATLLVVTLGLALRGRWHRRAATEWRSERSLGWATAGWGAAAGFIVGFTSIGSGTLVLPFLVWAYNVPAARLVGSSVFHAAILLTLTACLFAGFGSVEWDIAPWLIGGALPGVALGSRLAPRLPEKALRLVLMAVLLLSAWKLIR